LKALRGENVPRPPVWMMRQAGRYLPEYMVLRRKYDFFTRVQTPELAAEITLQPIDIIGPDAAILFSDILVIPQALGQEVQMVNNKGPFLPKTIENQVDINSLRNIEESADSLQYVYDAISLTKKELNNKVPLIGFAGAPFTILCYMVEGQGSKTFSKAKGFCFSQPTLAHELLSKITDLTIAYLKRKVAAGADVIQIFDSWSGLLSADDFNNFAKPYLDKITNALSEIAPVIIFAKGSWYALRDLTSSNASALGIDWCISPKQARDLTNHSITLQGNFDPHKLLLPIPELKNEVKAMIDSFGPQKYIANLGHGILPNIPVDHAKAFVDAVKCYNS
ncbi:MAG: uroporphyrinogen decarboxylase, partial [Bacteroidia bacterium]|nr:uroporphyrinogen decarboxylase [Bacteroidia bacterium]